MCFIHTLGKFFAAVDCKYLSKLIAWVFDIIIHISSDMRLFNMHSNSDQIGETNKDINYCDYSSSSSYCYGYQTVKRGPKIDCQWRWGNWSSCTRECASYIGLSVSTRYLRKLENVGPNQPMRIKYSWRNASCSEHYGFLVSDTSYFQVTQCVDAHEKFNSNHRAEAWLALCRDNSSRFAISPKRWSMSSMSARRPRVSMGPFPLTKNMFAILSKLSVA